MHRPAFTHISLLFLLIIGCVKQHLPAGPVEISDGRQHQIATACQHIYPSTPHQFAHTIAVTAPGNRKTALIGITRIFPNRQRIHCTLMSIEGLVLFEALHSDELTIKKALGPLESPTFAKALMADIALTYFPPDQTMPQTGLSKSAIAWRRYQSSSGTIDITREANGNWQIDAYSPTNQLQRTIRAEYKQPPCPTEFSPPKRLSITAPGLTGYRLDLQLLSSEAIEKDMFE